MIFFAFRKWEKKWEIKQKVLRKYFCLVCFNHRPNSFHTPSSNSPAPIKPQASSTASPLVASNSAYLKVLNAVVDAGGEDLVLPAAPRLGDNLDDLLQGAAHAVEHGVFVDPGRLAIRVPQAGLRRSIQTDMSKLGLRL